METKDFKKTKGITLIALVVTILILLILAGVSIVTLTGDNGILNQVQNASKLSEIARVEEEANLILTASVIDNRTSAKAIKDVGTILSELKADGKIENYGTTGNVAVTEIKFDTSSITIAQEDNETLTATFLPVNTAGGYYVVVKGKKYPVSKVNDKIEIGKMEITTDGNSTRVISDVESDDEDIATVEKVGTDGVKITGVAGGTANITVKYSESITTTIAVTVKTKYVVNLYASSEATTATQIKVVEGTSAFDTTGYAVPNAPSGQVFDKWVLKIAVGANAIGSDATSLLENVTQALNVYATYKDLPIAFRSYGEQVASSTYGTIGSTYSLTTGSETISVNSVTIADNWKIFYEDNDFLYLIYGDYYPALAQTDPDTGTNTINLAPNASFPYGVKGADRLSLLRYLRNYSGYSWNTTSPYGNNFESGGTTYHSWNDLKTAISGLSKMSGKTISVQGSPDIDLWVASWNAKYSSSAKLKESKETQGYNIMAYTESSNSNYYINVMEIPYNGANNEANKTGYYDRLYFPNRGISATEEEPNANKAYGYWLASPAGKSSDKICHVYYDGNVRCNNGYDLNILCARPVISIQKSGV